MRFNAAEWEYVAQHADGMLLAWVYSNCATIALRFEFKRYPPDSDAELTRVDDELSCLSNALTSLRRQDNIHVLLPPHSCSRLDLANWAIDLATYRRNTATAGR